MGERLRQAREEAGLDNKSAVAREVGVRPETMGRYEAGTLEPSAHIVANLAELYGVTTDWLIRGVESAPEAFREWADSPRGKAASPAARAWVASVRVPEGVTPDAAFYDALALAYEHQLSRAEAAAAAAETRALTSGD